MNSLIADGGEIKKAKGLNENFVKHIRHREFLMFCLTNK